MPAGHDAGSLQIGTPLGHAGRYRIVRMLGRGGFGEAYLARDSQLQRLCVVKRLVFDPDWNEAEREIVRASFEREARLLVSLNHPGHPNIPEIYEYLPDSQALVMKYIGGKSLAQMLNHRVDGLPQEEALRYAQAICSALAYMHRRTPEPVLHRDIKPSNVLLDDEQRIWVIDFGLAKGLPVQLAHNRPELSQSAGTPGYAPPEQWRGAAEPRSDVYALAVTFYVLLTNHHPAQMQGGQFPPVRQFNAAAWSEVETLIRRGIAPDIALRPSAQEFLDELDTIIAGADVPPPPELEHPPDVESFVGRQRELADYSNKLAEAHRAIITGQAGVGKTTLAAVLAQQVKQADNLFWHAFHSDEGVEVLLWELAAFLAHRGQPELWQSLHRTMRAGDSMPPPEILIDNVMSMLRGRDYMLCFDDFHLVEDNRIVDQFIQRLYRESRAGNLNLIIIITARHVPSFVPVHDFDLLGGLSREDTRHLLASRDLQLSTELEDELYRYTEGNAQFLMLAIDAIQHASNPARVISHLHETDDIERYLLTRVDKGLSDDERAVMEAIAVLLGFPGTRDAIEYMLDEGSVRRILRDLSDRRLIIASESEAGKTYRLHAMMQVFYYDQIGRRQRQAMHRRAGDYYETEQPDTLKAARHFERAGDTERAARLLTSDIWTLINRGQARALSQLLARFTAERVDVALWADIMSARGQVSALLGESEEARQSYQEALASLEQLPDTPDVRRSKARICRGMGAMLEYESPQEALEWLHRGLRELNGASDFEAAILRMRIGSALIASGDYSAALDELQHSLRLLPPGGGYGRAGVLTNLGVASDYLGDSEQANAFYEQALQIYQATGNYWGTVLILHNQGIVLETAGDWHAGVQKYLEAFEQASQMGIVSEQTTVALTLSDFYIKQGDIEAAQRYLAQGFTLAYEHRLKEYQIAAQICQANLYLRMDEWEEAERALNEAETLALEMQSHDQLPEIYRGRAQIDLLRQRPAQALGHAQHTRDLAHKLELDSDEGMGWCLLAQAYLASGQPAQAMEAFAQSLALLNGHNPYEAARTRMYWGAGRLLSGEAEEREQGKQLLYEAQSTFQALGAERDLSDLHALLQANRNRITDTEE